MISACSGGQCDLVLELVLYAPLDVRLHTAKLPQIDCARHGLLLGRILQADLLSMTRIQRCHYLSVIAILSYTKCLSPEMFRGARDFNDRATMTMLAPRG